MKQFMLATLAAMAFGIFIAAVMVGMPWAVEAMMAEQRKAECYFRPERCPAAAEKR